MNIRRLDLIFSVPIRASFSLNLIVNQLRSYSKGGETQFLHVDFLYVDHAYIGKFAFVSVNVVNGEHEVA
jgi:hypothetical protein